MFLESFGSVLKLNIYYPMLMLLSDNMKRSLKFTNIKASYGDTHV